MASTKKVTKKIKKPKKVATKYTWKQRLKSKFFIKGFMIPHPFFRSYILVMCMASFLITLMMGASVWWFHQKFYQDIEGELWILQKLIQNQLVLHSQTLAVVFLLWFMVLVIMMLLLGAFLAHRVVGPLHRLKNHADRAVSGGKVTAIHFRESDKLEDLAEIVNKLLKKAGVLK